MASGDVSFPKATGDSGAKGAPIAIDQTGSPYTTLHTSDATSSPTYVDVVTIEAWNVDTSTRTLTLLVNGTGDANKVPIELAPGAGPVVVVDRWPSWNGCTWKAYASAANKINVKVRVERYEE